MKLSGEYVVVGHGIAGSVLSQILLNKKLSVLVIDRKRDVISSKVAAGIWNPISFRRMIFAWNASEFIQYNRDFYQKIQEEQAVQFYHPKRYFKIFNSFEEQNLWMARSAEKDYENYLSNQLLSSEIFNGIEAPFGVGELYHAGFLETTVFLDTARSVLNQSKLLLEVEEDVALQHIDFKNKKIHIDENEISYEKLIFAEGFLAQPNGLFAQAPFKSVKGEVLTLHVPELNHDAIFNKTCFACAVGNNMFKVGSNFDWNNLNNQPTPEVRKMLISKFREFCKLDFELVDHQAAVRPASIDRRPFLGEHPLYPNTYIFNGLGAKGVMMAPLMAAHFVNYISGGTLPPEVDIARFTSCFKPV